VFHRKTLKKKRKKEQTQTLATTSVLSKCYGNFKKLVFARREKAW
jgi:hypothetical protein